MTGPRLCAIVLALSLAVPAAVNAEVLGWTSAAGGFGGPRLELVDLETGQAVEIGAYGIPDAEAGPLALDPAGTLFAIDSAQSRLLVVDPATGAATVVGGLGTPLFQIFGFAADACGRLWLTGSPTSVPAAPWLYQVDPATGQAAPVAPLSLAVYGLTARGEDLIGLIYGPNARVVRIDPATGAVSDELPVAGLSSIYPFALDRAPTGDLWIVGGVLIPIDPLPSAIVRIAPDGASEATYVGYFYYPGLAINPPAGFCGSGSPPAIPAASPLGLVALAAALAAAGLWVRRRSVPSRSGSGC
jgi:hypothetical protein